MPEFKLILHKLVFNVWDKEMIRDIQIVNSMNWSFQEAGLSGNDGRNAAPIHSDSENAKLFPSRISHYISYDIL